MISKFTIRIVVLMLIASGCQAQESALSRLFVIRQNGKCGYIDARGRLAVKPKFNYCNKFSEGLAAVSLNRKVGFIDETGKVAIQFNFDGVNPEDSLFRDGLCPVWTGYRSLNDTGKVGFIDKSGKFVVPPIFSAAQPFNQGLALVESRPLGNHFIDKSGRVVIQGQNYTILTDFEDGLASIFWENNKTVGAIDRDGKVAFSLPLSQNLVDLRFKFSEGLSSFTANATYQDFGREPNKDKCGYLNRVGATIVLPVFDKCGLFSEGLAAVSRNGKTGFINQKGTMVIGPKFENDNCSYMSGFKEGLSCVGFGKYGFIDTTGNILITTKINIVSISGFNGELARVYDSLGRFGYIDRAGRVVWPPSK